MALPPGRRVLVLAIVVAVAVTLGFILGWLAHVWFAPSPEARARDTLGEIRERAREITH